MNGRNHLITGTCIGADLCFAYMTAGGFPFREAVQASLDPVARYGPARGILAAAGCAALYLFGCVLPDIDNGGIVSKLLHFRLVVRHRGITHSVWLMAPFLAAACTVPGLWALRFLFLGMLMHCLADRPSTAGWVPFYPFGRWKVYNNVVINTKKHIELYGADKPGSETLLCIFVVAASALGWGTWAYFRFFNGGV